MTEPLRDRLRAAIPAAMKARDRATASTLRATLAAIENAEAVDVEALGVEALDAAAPDAGTAQPSGTAPRSGSLTGGGGRRVGAIEASAVGIGVAEVARRELTEADVAAIVRAEIAEREHAAEIYETSGHADQATELRAAASVLSAFLGDAPGTAA